MKLLSYIFIAMTLCLGAVAEENVLSAEEKAEGWMLLWDGKSYEGWMTSKLRPIERELPGDGTLAPLGTGGYILAHEEIWSDFVLSLEFKLTPEANSGVFIRTNPLKPKDDNMIWEHAIEVQVLDSAEAGLHDTGSFYDLKAPTKNALKPLGEWNSMTIVCDKNLIRVSVNGEEVNAIDLDEYTRPFRRPNGEEHKFPTVFKDHPREGYIGLQDHGDDVRYRNIKLKPLGGE